jgi:hypothetical protein
MRLLGSFVAVAVAALISLTPAADARAVTGARAGATVSVMQVRDSSISGQFICTNDPPGITSAVQVISDTSIVRAEGGTTPFTSLGVFRYDGTNILFDASGLSFDIGPTVTGLSRGSVEGTLPVEIVSQGGGGALARFQFTFTADRTQPTIDGPFVSNVVYPDGTRIVSRLMGQTRPATATGSVTVFDPGTGQVFFTCPLLRSNSTPDAPTAIQFVREGTITITK